jgi:L-iditol 2-dehydrogenase
VLAVVLAAPERLEVADQPEPRAAPGEALVRIATSGICGTDLSIYKGKIPVGYPRVLGHEFIGMVEDVDGPAPPGVKAGTRVIVDPNIYCGRCYQCVKGQNNICTAGALMGRDRDGGFCELVSVPASNLYPLPDAIRDEVAPLLQVVTVCVHGQRMVDIFPGDFVLVIGLGVTGLLHTQIAKARGAAVVVGITRSEAKRELAARLGADVVLDPAAPGLADAVREATGGRGFDVAIESAGTAATLAQAIELARIGGRVMAYGTIGAATEPLPYYQMYFKELEIVSPRAAKPEDFAPSLDLVAGGAVQLEPILSDTFPLAHAGDALEAIKRGGPLKVVLDHREGAG